VLEGWRPGPGVNRDSIWDPGELTEVIPGLVAEAAPNFSAVEAGRGTS
jgi:hypothetical protein